ncbi:hypothetical protein M5X11_32310 [Paenibacillus alginolyticus]|uniref:hypothetical protein n=1 Tax=Paenibacillus alginolyticus TaxID=59839 RepID=UPI000409940F|nr:hypothetical protein [Paenibacillus alginolyticus]MCY9669556.1 hypothetical protein [Paenibacillus alginolyticus]
MILIRYKLTYDEVRHRFEKEGYRLLSTKYKNAKSNLIVLCPCSHEWITNLSNFDSGRRCSICSRSKKYALEEVKIIFAREAYRVQNTIYINEKTPIKVACPNGHGTAINLNNFLNGRRCGLCSRMKAKEDRMKKLEVKAKRKERSPRREASADYLVVTDRTSNEFADQMKPEWRAKLNEMRKNLKSANRHTYRESEQQNLRRAGPNE